MGRKVKLSFVLLSCVLLSVMAFMKTEEFTVPKNWPAPVYNFKNNPSNASNIALGRQLFYDPLLSKDNTISCASCHLQYTAFTHVDHALSHGINDSIGTRNAPALMNLAWQSNFMWDGAINHLDVQALAPISHPDEMGETLSNVLSKLRAKQKYRTLFYKAYLDSSITGEQTLKAISQFMLTLVSSNSKYDSVQNHQSKFTEQEKKGYQLFKTHCNNCHTEPLFSNYQIENNGLPISPSLRDSGRLRITHNANDAFKFKIPSLRNIEFSYPYMHDGRFKKLSEVINHYTKGIQTSATLAPQLEKPIVLSSNEKVDLIAFLMTLTDKSFLFNPKFGYPKQKNN
jgi:cytochrome c peroxidase